jgi:HSP20 family protein
MQQKRSFFDRITGGHQTNDPFDSFDEDLPLATIPERRDASIPEPLSRHAVLEEERAAAGGEGELPVDVHQTANEIVIRAFVAGVRPDELNISISRDMVEISGARAEREQVVGDDYFIRELFWGSFSRKIMLPQEVDVENSSASARDGLVTLILPKLDKARQTKLRVKAG